MYKTYFERCKIIFIQRKLKHNIRFNCMYYILLPSCNNSKINNKTSQIGYYIQQIWLFYIIQI